jgi:FkbM family methyltransferase
VMMTSYAQNHEDVVLARARPASRGFYIDVGAASPDLHSVTKHFYGLGWRGINIEPLEAWHRELVQRRPRDINLQLAMSDEPGTAVFYDAFPDAAEESTMSAEVAHDLQARGIGVTAYPVEAQTLASVCEAHVTEQIDFLKIDTEGWELHVIAGADWARFRPLIVVVESPQLGSPRRLAGSADGVLSEAGYSFALFDGLNRFYVRNEDPDLLSVLQAPVCLFDEYVDADVAQAEAEAQTQAAQLSAAHARLRETVARADADARNHAEQRLAVEARLREAEHDLRVAKIEASDAEIQFQATREALEHLLAHGPS